MKSKVSLRLDELTHHETATFADSIISHTTGNANYPTPTASITDIRSAKNAHRTSISKANIGNREMIAIRNEELVELSDLLNAVGSYIQLSYKGFESVILSGAFPLCKPNTRGVLPFTPSNFKIRKKEFVGFELLEWKTLINSHLNLVHKMPTLTCLMMHGHFKFFKPKHTVRKR